MAEFPYKTPQASPKAGCLLVAEPFMIDPHFGRGVILLCEHEQDGCYGVMLNKSLKLRADEVLKSINNFAAPVFYGGPVQTDMIYYLHTQGDLIKGSLEVAAGVYWGGAYEELIFCIKHELIKPDEVCFYVGYSGWDLEQLAGELEEGSWFCLESHANYVFKPSEDLWKQVLEDAGGNLEVIAQMPKPLYS